MIVDQRGQEVVCRRDSVHIAGKMQIDFFHRHNLRITAAGRAALNAKHRTERRLTQGNDRFSSNQLHRIAETDRGRGLALAGRRRIDRGNQNQLPVGLVRERAVQLLAELAFILSIRLNVRFVNAERRRNLCNRLHLRLLRNFNVRKHLISSIYSINNWF